MKSKLIPRRPKNIQKFQVGGGFAAGVSSPHVAAIQYGQPLPRPLGAEDTYYEDDAIYKQKMLDATPIPGLPGGRDWGYKTENTLPVQDNLETLQNVRQVAEAIDDGATITAEKNITVDDTKLLPEEVEGGRTESEQATAKAREAANKAQAAKEKEKATIQKIQKMNGVAVDGIWGPKTQAAFEQVTAIQKKLVAAGHNIKVDGVMGPKTRAAQAEYTENIMSSADDIMDDVQKREGMGGTQYGKLI